MLHCSPSHRTVKRECLWQLHTTLYCTIIPVPSMGHYSSPLHGLFSSSIHGPLSQFILWTVFQFHSWTIIPVHSVDHFPVPSVDHYSGWFSWLHGCRVPSREPVSLLRVRLVHSGLSDPFKCQGKRRAGCSDLVSVELLQSIPSVRCFMQLSILTLLHRLGS